MATAPDIRRSPLQWTSEFWAHTSTANKLTLGGVLLVLLVVVVGLVVSSQPKTEGRVALLEGYKFTSDESRAAIQAFSTANLRDYEYVGGQILVPRTSVNAYLQALAAADAFGDNFDKPIDDYINNQRTWWASQSDAERLLHIAKEKTVGKMIASMAGVEEAVVVVARPDRLTLRRTGNAKASVAITAFRSLPASQLEQAKQIVANAFHDLSPTQVNVVVTNRPGAKGGAMGHAAEKCVDTDAIKSKNEYLQTKEAYAECVESAIRRLLADLDGVEVVANVDVDTPYDVRQRIVSFQKGAIASQETSSRNTETPAGGGPAGGEPGFRTNVDLPGTPPAANQAMSATASATPATESDESNSTLFDNNRVETEQKIVGLIPKKVGVVVNIPRRYLEPTTAADGQSVPASRNEQDIIDAIVRLGYPGLTPESVKVVRYTPAPAPEVTPAGLPVGEIVRDYASPALLGALGLIAVLTALRVTRRATVPTVVTPPDDVVADKEVSDEELLPKLPASVEAQKYEKLQETVTTIIQSDSDAAASLVRRWIASDE